MFHIIPALLIAGLLACLPLQAAPLTVDEAQRQALAQHPQLQASRAQWQAATQYIAQAQALPEPQLMIGLANLPVGRFSLNDDPMSQLQLALMQRLPYPGKLADKEALAGQNAAVQRAYHDEQQLQLLAQVSQRWWALFSTEKALQILSHNRSLVRQLVGITQTKYKVGDGLQQDVLLAQLELSKLMERELTLQGEHQAQRYQLNRLMGHPVGREIVLAVLENDSLPVLLPIEHLQQLAVQRPILLGQQARISAAEYEYRLAEKDYNPDFQLSAQYALRDGWDDLFSVRLSMNLPLFSAKRQDPALSQRNSELKQQRYQLQNLQQQVESRIAITIARYQQLREQVGLLRDGILPQARQTVDSMRVGYQVDKVDFLNLARAQQTLYEYETQYWQALSEAQQLLAQLQAEVAEEHIYE